jgi:cytochrome c oxidase subunit 2
MERAGWPGGPQVYSPLTLGRRIPLTPWHRVPGKAKTVGRLVGPAGLAAPLLLAGCAPQSITEQGAAIGRLYNLFLVIAAVVWTTVTGVMVWSLVRYRRKDGDDRLPKQIHGNKYWELSWTLIPLVIIAVLIVATVKTQNTVLHQQPDPDLTVEVTGFQWSWRFAYPESGTQVVGSSKRPPELVVPADHTVHVRLRSADVIHNFYIPRTLFKRYAIPGTTNEFDLTFTETGRYDGNCAQFCGFGHPDMVFTLRVVTAEEFTRWLTAARSRPIAGYARTTGA